MFILIILFFFFSIKKHKKNQWLFFSRKQSVDMREMNLLPLRLERRETHPVCCCMMKDGTVVHLNHCTLNENGLQVCAGHSFCCHIPTPVLLRRMMCAESDTRRLFSLSLVKEFIGGFFVFNSKSWKSGLVKIQQTFKPPESKHGKLNNKWKIVYRSDTGKKKLKLKIKHFFFINIFFLVHFSWLDAARINCWLISWTSFSTSFSNQPLWYFSLEAVSTLEFSRAS